MSLVLMLAFTLGWHWTLLQSVGWVQMFLEYAQTAPVTEALVKTFDGKNPCKVCKLVEAGKKSEQENGSAKHAGKLDLFFERATALLFPPEGPGPAFALNALDAQLLSAPPYPPPRLG